MDVENIELKDNVSSILQKGMFSKENLIECIKNSNQCKKSKLN
jgi:hypothetical protein